MNAKQPRGQRIMSVKEISECLKIPASTIYHLAKMGKIRGVKYGKHWRFLEEDVLSYLYQHRSLRCDQTRFIERRDHPRMNTEIPASLAVLLFEKKGLEKKGMVRNISEGGLLFADPNSSAGFEAGDPVKVMFQLPGEKSQEMRLEGRIVHVLKNARIALGIKFRNISLVDQGVIRNYVG